MELISPNFFDHFVIVLLGIILPVFAIFQSQPELKKVKFNTALKVEMYYGNGLTLWIMTLIICFVWFFSGRPLPTIGFQPPIFNNSLPFILTGVLVVLYAGDTLKEIWTEEARQKVIKRWQADAPFLPSNKLEFQHFIILSFTAGFCEEVIFRGYFIQYLMTWTGTDLQGQWLAVLIPGLVFAVSHWYQGWKAVLKIMVLAIIFGFIFLETKSLWIVIILHFLIDLVGGYIAYQIFPENVETESK